MKRSREHLHRPGYGDSPSPSPASTSRRTEAPPLDDYGASDPSSIVHQQAARLQLADCRIRLRALSCLHAHLDLLCDVAERARLADALRCHLWREEDPHVAQLLVRVLTSLAIMCCKSQEPGDAFESGRVDDADKGDASICMDAAEELETSCQFCRKSAPDKAATRRDTVRLGTIEQARLLVETLQGYIAAEGLPLSCRQSSTLKLQILRSLSRIAKETGAVQLDALCPEFTQLLASRNPFIRAHVLLLVAMAMVTDPGAKRIPTVSGKESNNRRICIFEEYTRDPDVIVRTAALKSLIIVRSNSYSLTRGCYVAASVLLGDLHETLRSLALQVIGLWLEEQPEEGSSSDHSHDDAFIQVCRMMIDMDFSVRIEACKALIKMTNVREDLVLQALSKKPLGLAAKEKDLSASSLITIPESDVDVSKFEEGLSILDKLIMGAFVHGIEDEFLEVRELTVRALAKLCDCSPRVRENIVELLVDMLNDDSKQVRSTTILALFHVAHKWAILGKNNYLHMYHETVEDADANLRCLGRKLLANIRLPTVDSFNSAIQILMNNVQQHPEEEVSVFHALYRLGRAHSTYIQFLMEGLMEEIKSTFSGDVGLDAPRCGCILVLFAAAAASDANFISLVPIEILSVTRFLRQNLLPKCPALEVESVHPQAQIFRWLGAATEHVVDEKKGLKDFLASTLQTASNAKSMLEGGMLSNACQMLSGCRRDLKSILGKLREQKSIATYSLHFVECLVLISQSWIHFQQKETQRLDLSYLCCKLDLVVKCMQHTFTGHSSEQRLQLLELSMVPLVWRVASKIGRSVQIEHNKLMCAMASIEMITQAGFAAAPFMEGVRERLLKYMGASDSVNSFKVACQLASLYWPKSVLISDSLRELKVELIVPGNDFERPLLFMPGLPLGISVKIRLNQSAHNSRIWVRMQMDSVFTQFMFLNIQDGERVKPITTTIQVYGVPSVSKCTLKAALQLECPVEAGMCIGRGPKGVLLPLTPEKEIHLVSNAERAAKSATM